MPKIRDNTDGFALPYFKGNILERPELPVELLVSPPQHLHQTMPGLIVNLIALAEVFDLDGGIVSHDGSG